MLLKALKFNKIIKVIQLFYFSGECLIIESLGYSFPKINDPNEFKIILIQRILKESKQEIP